MLCHSLQPLHLRKLGTSSSLLSTIPPSSSHPPHLPCPPSEDPVLELLRPLLHPSPVPLSVQQGPLGDFSCVLLLSCSASSRAHQAPRSLFAILLHPFCLFGCPCPAESQFPDDSAPTFCDPHTAPDLGSWSERGSIPLACASVFLRPQTQA